MNQFFSYLNEFDNYVVLYLFQFRIFAIIVVTNRSTEKNGCFVKFL